MIVMELMFAAWLAEQGYPYTRTERAVTGASIYPWEHHMVRPLRLQRKRWVDNAQTAVLYAHAQQLELAAERATCSQLVLAYPRFDEPLAPTSLETCLTVFSLDVPDAAGLMRQLGEIFVQLRGADPEVDAGES